MTQQPNTTGRTGTGLKLAAAIGALTIVLGGAAWAGGGKWHGGMFERLDTNKDERVNREEIKPFADKRFTRLDTDGDGVVTTAEIDAHILKRVEKHRERLLERFDGDGDGKVTRAEYDTQVARMFDRVDTDEDGMVSRHEARKMRKHMRARWHRRWHDEDAGETEDN